MLSRSPIRYLLRHTFSGAALTPSDLGPPLTVLVGAVTVSGGVIKPNGFANVRVGTLEVGANRIAQAKFRFNAASVAADRRAIINFRSDGAAGGSPTNGLEVCLSRSGQYVAAYTRTGGAATDIGNTSVAVADSTDYWLRVAFTGSRIEVLLSTDGSVFTSLFVTSSSLYLSQTGVDLRLNDAGSDGNGANGLQADDLQVWAA